MYGKLFLLTLCIFASVIQNCHGTSCSDLLENALYGALFGLPCTLSDLTNEVANGICSSDCYCVHGAPSGGYCAKGPPEPELRAACNCNYTAPDTPLSVSCSSNPTNVILALECGPLAVGIHPLTGEQVCNLECSCFHGASGGECSNTGVITDSGAKRCKCTYP